MADAEPEVEAAGAAEPAEGVPEALQQMADVLEAAEAPVPEDMHQVDAHHGPALPEAAAQLFSTTTRCETSWLSK